MNRPFKSWKQRLGILTAASAALLASCASFSQAEPDYNQIGKQFSLVLQNAHFDRIRFSQKMYEKFLESYLQASILSVYISLNKMLIACVPDMHLPLAITSWLVKPAI